MVNITKIDNGIYTAKCPLCKSVIDVSNIIAGLDNARQVNEGAVLELCSHCRNNTIVGRLEAMKRSMKKEYPVFEKVGETKVYNPEIQPEEFTTR